MTDFSQLPEHHAVLRAAYNAWAGASRFRANRLRNKRFTYGDQWHDLMDRSRDDALTRQSGNNALHITEWDYYHDRGSTPITNNLLRQLVKTIVGRFRTHVLANEKSLSKAVAVASRHNLLDELDSRALEEFLISGSCVQRIDVERHLLTERADVRNVNANNFFMNPVRDPLLRDCEIVGQLHDMGIAHVVRLLSGGSRGRGEWLRKVCGGATASDAETFANALGADNAGSNGFWQPAESGKCRVIEVWTLESREVTLCHDTQTATVSLLPHDCKRSSKGDKRYRWDIAMVWHCRWFSNTGVLLDEYDSPFAHGEHPFAIKLYPLTDGEVHSFVEDVIDQQKYVNRLITLIDHIMLSSAKGVLVFPESALPDNFSWSDMRKIWSNCNGLLPYNDSATSAMPQQISTNNTNIGAFEMVQLQMRLLEEISGVTGALQGRAATNKNSVRLYEAESQNSANALADIFETFNSFRKARNRKIEGM